MTTEQQKPGALPRKPPVRMADEGMGTETPVAAADVAAEVRALREDNAALREDMKMLMELVKASTTPVAVEMADKPPVKMSEGEEMTKNDRIAELEAELASLRMENEATAEVAALEDEYVVAEPLAMRDVYVKGGKAAFEAAKRCLPKRGATPAVGITAPAAKPRTALAGGAKPAMQMGDRAHADAIKAYQTEHNVSYEAARVAIHKQYFAN